ncbi:hypothetical protein CEXT_99011 [Caerostris extrusa]|uniref:Uncharacterized protein n=1 Tax=Caerostris extrusa TaxID=172846 RepID=A0AAV4R743_CAEEX|nr:hypothetical protein CEXT_99011 [Caerostris extrusa]
MASARKLEKCRGVYFERTHHPIILVFPLPCRFIDHWARLRGQQEFEPASEPTYATLWCRGGSFVVLTLNVGGPATTFGVMYYSWHFKEVVRVFASSSCGGAEMPSVSENGLVRN